MDIQSNQYLRQVIDSSVEEFDVVLAKMQFILTVLEDVVSLLGLLGNLLIILFFIKSNRKNLKKMTPYLFLLIQLAIVDSLICIEIILTSHYLGNLFGIQYISINIGLLKLYMLDSNLLLILVSFLRYQNIVHPLKTKWRKQRFCCLSLGAFLLSCFIFVPGSGSGDHLNHFTPSDFATAIVALLSFILAFWFYHKISRALAKAPHARAEERNKKALATLKFLILLFSVSVVLGKMLYICISIVLERSGLLADRSMFKLLHFVEQIVRDLIYLNSVGNFFIYLKTVPGFYQFVLTILCRSFQKGIAS